MGVIRVNVEAIQHHGYQMGDLAWSNLGQGQPEVGDLPGAPPRIATLPILPQDHAYGPIEGIPEFREAIAEHYNRLYRQGKSSKFTAENVAVAPGGRAALTRIGAILGKVNLGYFTPDYTAYEDLLTTFSNVNPIWIELTAAENFLLSSDGLRERITRDKLEAILISNPCNPTGAVIKDEELAGWCRVSDELGTTFIMDEFYSHFIYDGRKTGVSAAEFVDDVNSTNVVIVDGLTKSFRYPGWRVGWVIASKDVIQKLAAAGSFLDGGCCRPIQRAAIQALEPTQADLETQAVRDEFSVKQRLTIEALESVGIQFPHAPVSTFYAWGDISRLPEGLNRGEDFMRAGFSVKVLTVPGEYFDVNPYRSRTQESPLTSWVRFSFGPTRTNLTEGLDRLVTMLKSRL